MSTSLILLLVLALTLFMAGSWLTRQTERSSWSPGGFDSWLMDHGYTAAGLGSSLAASGILVFAAALVGSPELQLVAAVPLAALAFIATFSGLCGVVLCVCLTLGFIGEVITFRRDLRDDWHGMLGRVSDWKRNLRHDWSADRGAGLALGAVAAAEAVGAVALTLYAYWPMLASEMSK